MDTQGQVSVEGKSSMTSPRAQDSIIDTCPAGTLDGLTIMRYAPFHSRERSNGGVEQYLRCLNRGLLQRHDLAILQVYRVRDIRGSRVDVEQVERGRVFWVPVPHQHTGSRFKDLPARARFVWRQTVGFPLEHPETKCKKSFATTRTLFEHSLRHLRHRSVTLSDPLSELLSACKVDLLAVHGLTYDADVLIDQAKKSGIPFVLINHFDNAHYCDPQVQEWIPDAAGVGAVSARDVPSTLRGSCVNLSDAVDTEFFALEQAQGTHVPASPMILLPALIKPGKGHQDLIRAAKILARRKLDFEVCFAGAVESDSLCGDLRNQATDGLEFRVHFVGELGQNEIRNYYRLSSVVVLPSYCEGLGRSLLEAQAMQRPVVAYDSGGISETLLQNETGFLVKTGDVESLADKIGFLLTNEAARHSMGKRGREFVTERFSVAALIERHEKFYLRALAHSSRRFCRSDQLVERASD